MKCQSCGADNALDSATCVYCNSQLQTTDSSDKTKVFASVKGSEVYAQRNSAERHAKLPKLGVFQKFFMFAFFVVFIGFSAVMCIVAWGVAGVFGVVGVRGGSGFGAAVSIIPILFSIVPMAFVALGVFMLIKSRKKMASLEEDPVETDVVIVVDKRTQVSGGSGESSATTHYFATCEGEDGSRQEYQLWDGNLYGRMTAGDAGVLFVRAGYGLDFDRVAI